MYIYIVGVGTAFLNVISDQFLPLLSPSGSFLTSGCGADTYTSIPCRWKFIVLYTMVIELPLCLL